MAQNEPQRKETPPGPSPNSPSLLFEYQCRSGKFIRLANRIESKLFCPNWHALVRSRRRRGAGDGRQPSDPTETAQQSARPSLASGEAGGRQRQRRRARHAQSHPGGLPHASHHHQGPYSHRRHPQWRRQRGEGRGKLPPMGVRKDR